MKRWLASPLLWGLLALVCFLLMLSPWAYPGDGTPWMAQCLGVLPDTSLSLHPLASLVYRGVGALLPTSMMVTGLNALTALVGALCVALLCWVVGHLWTALALEHERSKPFIPAVQAVSVPIAALTLLLTPGVVRAATHAQWQTFDLFLILCTALLIVRVAENGSRARMLVAAFAWGLFSMEAPLFLLLTPVVMIVLAVAYYFGHEGIRLRRVITHLLIPMAIGGLLSLGLVASMMGDAALSVQLRLAVTTRILGILEWQHAAWILVLVSGALPGLLAILLAPSLVANRRSMGQLVAWLAMLLFALLALSEAPLSLTRTMGELTEVYPLFLLTLTAFALAVGMGACAFFILMKRSAEGGTEQGLASMARRLSALLGHVGAVIIPLCLVGFGLWGLAYRQRAERALAGLPKQYADTVLAACGDDTSLLISDGKADAYLALRIAETGKPITLVPTTNDLNVRTLEDVRATFLASSLFEGKKDLRDALDRALDIGLVPFVQDWLRRDPEALKHLLVLSIPDLLLSGDAWPLPEKIYYRGVATREALHAQLPATYEAPFPELDALRAIDAEKRPEVLPSGVLDFATYVLRQESFISNNIAFFLADAGRTEEAYQLFKATYRANSDNVSALLNVLEMVKNQKLHPEDDAWCNREFAALQKKLNGRKFLFWSLTRTYGYIRSPMLMSMVAGSWALSGQMGAALCGLDLAMEMLGDEQRPQFQGVQALVYSSIPEKRAEAIARYKAMLAEAREPHQTATLLKDLIRINLMDGNFAEARKFLEEARGKIPEQELAYEHALYYAAAGDVARARLALQTYLDYNAKSADALALLASLQLQMGDAEIADLKANTLPRLITAVGREDDYLVLIIQAQLAEREQNFERARTCYLRALVIKPEMHALRDAVLLQDIRLNDRASAAIHARDYLYRDRTLVLANYIMGSNALNGGDLERAERYLLVATSGEKPRPEAFNDLAETYRRQGRWSDALAAAQQAIDLAPNLAIAYETRAAALLELNQFNEAIESLQQAIAKDLETRKVTSPDPRMTLTFARILERQGKTEEAKLKLLEVRKVQSELDPGAASEYKALAERLGVR